MSERGLHTRRIVLSALFLAIALVFRTFFRMYIPLFGEGGMRIGVHIIFSSMPAVLFGPLYGAMVAGLTDFLGHFISPSAGWLPQLTLSATVGGFLRGWLFMWLKKYNPVYMRWGLGCVGVLFVLFGALNLLAFRADSVTRDFFMYTEPGAAYVETEGLRLISRLAVTRGFIAANPGDVLGNFILFTTTGLMGSGGFLLLLLALDWVMYRFSTGGGKVPILPTMALILAMMLPAILVNSFNTLVFRYTIFTSWQVLPFYLVWLPRVLQSIATTAVNIYVIALLFGLCEKHPAVQKIIRK